MADPNQGQTIATLWEAVVGKKPTNNIFNSRALFYALGDEGFKEQVPGGRLFEMTIEYAQNTTFKSYGEFETLDTTRIDVFDCARYDQKIAAGTIVFSDLELARNAEANRKIDILESKLENGKNSAIASLNVMLNGDGTGNGGKDFDGIQKIISATPTTGTVGGINRATFSFWRNRQNAGTKTSTAYDNLRTSMTTTYNQCSLGGVESTPTAAITDRATFEGYESLLVAVEKIERDAKATGGDIAFLNDAIQFKGAALFYDEDAAASELRFVNPKYLKLMYLAGAWMKMKEPVTPSNQMTRVYVTETFGNLGTNGSRYLGVVSAIS
ncbi:hypothetical protein UFOVP509_40 [uncultured Caudovirales phage]|uniref:Uncharacterized protein n=1 Tax=uncultured Caudovirales phage TaxID=2100421 RepID=A0A6J5MKE2_9CAUD|nr:hypothetical protein UFOVP509_40 [uncultured Caudovirales phage]